MLWWQAYGGAIMLSKDAPLKSPADIKNKKVRVFGKTLGEFVTATGGVPVMTSGSEQYVAYQRGTVDAGMTGVSGVQSRKLWQVMDHITVTNHADVEFLVLIKEQAWQGLTDGFALVCILLFSIVAIYYGLEIMLDSIRQGRASATMLAVPKWMTEAAIPLGFLLLGLQAVAELIRLPQDPPAIGGDRSEFQDG